VLVLNFLCKILSITAAEAFAVLKLPFREETMSRTQVAGIRSSRVEWYLWWVLNVWTLSVYTLYRYRTGSVSVTLSWRCIFSKMLQASSPTNRNASLSIPAWQQMQWLALNFQFWEMMLYHWVCSSQLFLRIIGPFSLFFFYCLTMKMKELWPFDTAWAASPLMLDHILEELNFQHHHCEVLRSFISYISCSLAIKIFFF